LGSHTLKWPVGGVFIVPTQKLAVGEKLLLYAAHRTVPWPLSSAPSRWTDTIGDRWRVCFLHRTLRTSHLFSPQCHLELVVGLLFPSAPDSPACDTGQSGVPPDSPVLQTRQSACNTSFVSWTSLDLHNVLFLGVAFLNALVQVTLASCELQTQTLANTLVHRLC
jgi:hypothetical protein